MGSLRVYKHRQGPGHAYVKMGDGGTIAFAKGFPRKGRRKEKGRERMKYASNRRKGKEGLGMRKARSTEKGCSDLAIPMVMSEEKKIPQRNKDF
jgi:hypothetical protein